MKKILSLCFLITSYVSLAQNTGIATDPLANKYERILHQVAKMIKDEHYINQPIDNALSEKIWQDYIKKLDSDKSIFLADDIKKLEKYKYLIDEEINGSSVKFFNEANEIYLTRIKEIQEFYPKLKKNSYDFSVADSISFKFEDLSYAQKSKQQKAFWDKKLKYYTLQRYYDLIEARKNAKTDSIKNREDKTLMNLAIAGTDKTIIKFFDRILKVQNDENRFGSFVNSFVYQFDPHSGYFGVVEKRTWDERISGKFYGIGTQLINEDGVLKVTSVNEGGPAWKSGEVKEGDVFLKVGELGKEPVDIQGFETDDAIKLIRGAQGSTVVITFKGVDGAIKVVSMERDEVKLEETFAKGALFQKDSLKIGYITLPKFYMPINDPKGRRTSEDMEKLVKDLTSQGARNIVIDLRNNGGGSLNEVIKATGLFVNGPIVQVRDRENRHRTFNDQDGNKIVFNGPLAVLVNEYSASASEIFAAGIQDHNRGIIIGSSSTYGKGTVQRPTSVSTSNTENLGSLHLTYQKYYRINGSTVQLKGVVPDIVMPSYYEDFKVKEKDKPTALAFDETRKLDYKIWENTGIEPVKIKNLQVKISNDSILAKIQTNGKWLANQSGSYQTLKLDDYVAKMQKRRELIKLTNDINKINQSAYKIVWTSSKADNEKATEANNRWEKALLSDIGLHYGLDLFLKEDLGTAKSE